MPFGIVRTHGDMCPSKGPRSGAGSATANADSAASLQVGGLGSTHVTCWSGSQALGTRGGLGAATFRTAPRPQALRRRRTRTRLGPRRLRHQERARWPLETLGYTQPRDSHVQGEPDARAEPTAQLMPDERGGCACCTATKYRNNTTTTTHHPEGLDAALACSVADIVAVAGSSR